MKTLLTITRNILGAITIIHIITLVLCCIVPSRFIANFAKTGYYQPIMKIEFNNYEKAVIAYEKAKKDWEEVKQRNQPVLPEKITDKADMDKIQRELITLQKDVLIGQIFLERNYALEAQKFSMKMDCSTNLFAIGLIIGFLWWVTACLKDNIKG